MAGDLFRTSGYDHASMEAVVQATGLNRYALYKTFGGKQDLFIAAFQAYHEQAKAAMATLAARADFTALQALEAAVIAHVREVCDAPDSGVRGCLTCIAMTEVAPHEPEVHAAVQAVLDDMRAVFGNVFETARGAGEIQPETDPQRCAALLASLLVGFGAQARIGQTAADLEPLVTTFFDALRAPPSSAG
ncbi:MAG: TetR/AcrR family transcriptional regulator [Maricaulaceae bacterium]